MNPITTHPSVQVQATVTVKRSDGGVVTPDAIAWATDDSNVATIDSNGVVTPLAVGSVGVTATCTVGTQNVVGNGVVNVALVDNQLVATVDFSLIIVPPADGSGDAAASQG